MSKVKDASVGFSDAFCLSMDREFSAHLSDVQDIAVAVSGGADSMALCHALSDYFADTDMRIHAITVDHRLREEATAEAEHVAGVLRDLPNISHVTLRWNYEEKPKSRVQEEARKARYDLMQAYMAEHDIRNLFLGHHMDDQAETFLFRLAKGSGLDGLSCMSPMQESEGGVVLCRPMLSISRVQAVAFCEGQGIEYIDDPSNGDDRYARVRLRESMSALEAEGLTPQRLARTAMRMERAREALNRMAGRVFDDNALKMNSNRIVFNFNNLINNDKEVIFRVVLRGVQSLSSSGDYGVRMQKLEALCDDLCAQADTQAGFRKRTLGGVVFEVDFPQGHLILSKEK